MPVPYTFGTATAAIPLSQLDSNFSTAITIGNTAVQLGNTVTTLNNMTLANVTISSGNVTLTNVSVTTANVSGTANVSSLVVLTNETVLGNTTVTGNVTASTSVVTPFVSSAAATNLLLKSAGTTAVTIDTSQNVGVGVTPSAWKSNYKATQVGNAASIVGRTDSNNNYFSSNWYVNSSNQDIYQNTGFATIYSQGTGTHAWYNAPSGTSGNAITFTQAMTLDASGNLTLNASSPNIGLEVKSTGYAASLKLTSTSGVDSANRNWRISANSVAAGNLDIFRSTSDGGTASTQVASFDSSGNLLVGTTSARPNGLTSDAQIVATTASATKFPIATSASLTAAQTAIVFTNPNGNVGSIQTSGSATSYVTSSDYRLKNSIAPMTDALAKIAELKPVTYKWNVDGSDGQGFIAHELQSVVPDAVIGEKDAINADGKPMYQGVDTSFLVATLTAAIKEQQALIVSMRDELDALKAKVGA